MKKLILFFSLVVMNTYLLGNVQGEYDYMSDYNSDIACSLLLLPNNIFKIEISISATEDQIFVPTISYGNWEIDKNKNLILTDAITGKIIAKGKFGNNSVKLSNTFVFINDCVFRKTNTVVKNDESLNNLIAVKNADAYKQIIGESSLKPYLNTPVQSGWYYNTNQLESEVQYSLKIEQNGNYSLYMCGTYQIFYGKIIFYEKVLCFFDNLTGIICPFSTNNKEITLYYLPYFGITNVKFSKM